MPPVRGLFALENIFREANAIKSYIALARPKCWLKNIFVFVPIVFSLEMFNWAKLAGTAAVFAAFCLVASAVYAFNDICDAEKDAAHPVKKARPVASGVLTKKAAGVFAAALAASGLALGAYISILSGVLIVAYVAVNLLYSLKAKNVPVFDCFLIAAGFVLRIYAGGVACGEPVSDWLFLTVVAMSLFMAFGKRRGEFAEADGGESGRGGKKAPQRYDQGFLRGMVFTCAGLAVVFYSLWALARGHYMIYTVPLIVFIVAQYLMLIHRPGGYGDPTTVIFGDRVLLAAVGLYGALTVFLLYWGGVGYDG